MKFPPFLIELVKRFAAGNPKFFKVIQVISGLVAVIAFLPDLASYFEFDLPTWLNLLHDKAIKVGSLTAIIIAQLPNPSVAEPKP